MTRYLITGGAGFIGSHLVERLLQDDDTEHVAIADDLSTGSVVNIHGVVEGDHRVKFAVLEAEDAGELLSYGVSADHIIHLASVVGVQRVLQRPIETMVSVETTHVLAEYAKRKGSSLLIASSSEVYGTRTGLCSETDELHIGPSHVGRWAYAVSKLACEHVGLAAHRENGAPVRIARLFNTVGPRQVGDYGMVLPRFVVAALRGEPLIVHGDGSQSRCFVHVRDTVEALVGLLRAPGAVGEVVNVGNNVSITIRGLAERVRDRLKSSSPIEYIPYARLGRHFEDLGCRIPDTTKLQTLVPEWRVSKTLDDVIDDVAAHVVAHPERY